MNKSVFTFIERIFTVLHLILTKLQLLTPPPAPIPNNQSHFFAAPFPLFNQESVFTFPQILFSFLRPLPLRLSAVSHKSFLTRRSLFFSRRKPVSVAIMMRPPRSGLNQNQKISPFCSERRSQEQLVSPPGDGLWTDETLIKRLFLLLFQAETWAEFSSKHYCVVSWRKLAIIHHLVLRLKEL